MSKRKTIIEAIRKHYLDQAFPKNVYGKRYGKYNLALVRQFERFPVYKQVTEAFRNIELLLGNYGEMFVFSELDDIEKNMIRSSISRFGPLICKYYSLDDFFSEDHLDDIVEAYEINLGVKLEENIEYYKGNKELTGELEFFGSDLEAFVYRMNSIKSFMENSNFGNLDEYVLILHRIEDLPQDQKFDLNETLEFIGIYKMHAACWALRRGLEKVSRKLLGVGDENANLSELLNELKKRELISGPQYFMFQYIREIGNQGVHGSKEFEIFDHNSEDILKVAIQYLLFLIEKNKDKLEVKENQKQ